MRRSKVNYRVRWGTCIIVASIAATFGAEVIADTVGIHIEREVGRAFAIVDSQAPKPWQYYWSNDPPATFAQTCDPDIASCRVTCLSGWQIPGHISVDVYDANATLIGSATVSYCPVF